MQSPGWQLTLCVAWCLIWWFVSLEKYGHTWHRMSVLRPGVIKQYKPHMQHLIKMSPLNQARTRRALWIHVTINMTFSSSFSRSTYLCFCVHRDVKWHKGDQKIYARGSFLQYWHDRKSDFKDILSDFKRFIPCKLILDPRLSVDQFSCT